VAAFQAWLERESNWRSCESATNACCGTGRSTTSTGRRTGPRYHTASGTNTGRAASGTDAQPGEQRFHTKTKWDRYTE
jgi:hypothetical protein